MPMLQVKLAAGQPAATASEPPHSTNCTETKLPRTRLESIDLPLLGASIGACVGRSSGAAWTRSPTYYAHASGQHKILGRDRSKC